MTKESRVKLRTEEQKVARTYYYINCEECKTELKVPKAVALAARRKDTYTCDDCLYRIRTKKEEDEKRKVALELLKAVIVEVGDVSLEVSTDLPGVDFIKVLLPDGTIAELTPCCGGEIVVDYLEEEQDGNSS